MKKFAERKFKHPIKSVTLNGRPTGDFHSMGDIMEHFPWTKIQMESDIQFHESTKKKGEQDFRDFCSNCCVIRVESANLPSLTLQRTFR